MRATRFSARRRTTSTFTPIGDCRTTISGTGSCSAARSRRLRASRVVVLRGFQLAWLYTYGSPQPFNIVTGGDRNNDTNVNDRPVGVGRNTGVGFDYHSLDLRLGYRFRMAGVSAEASLDAFNVLNRTNLLFPNNTFGQGLTPLPAFGLATAAADPRQLQLGRAAAVLDAVRRAGDDSASEGHEYMATYLERVDMRCTPSIVMLLAMAFGGSLIARQPNLGTVQLAIEGRANATPWVAARGPFVAVAWGATAAAGGTDVYVAVSRDSAGTFDSPVRVNARPGTARLGGELPPRVALSPVQPAVPSLRSPSSGAQRKRPPRSEVRGQSMADGHSRRAFLERTTGAAGDRGWHALAIDEGGTPHILWLDHRGLAARPKMAHDHHGDGADMAQFSGLYYSTGAGERELAKGVCYCCKVAFAAGTDGSLFAAWRHVYKGNIRDIAFAASRDGGRTFSAPSRVSEDNWQLAGCPDDGPAIGHGRMAWFTSCGRR